MIRLGDGTLTSVPVHVNGIAVGIARINPDGNIVLMMGTPNVYVQEFKRQLEIGDADGIYIGLVYP
jgi:phosphoribosylformylglycinamidine (FGAM) synthase-like amidotransferase family enzyme